MEVHIRMRLVKIMKWLRVKLDLIKGQSTLEMN